MNHVHQHSECRTAFITTFVLAFVLAGAVNAQPALQYAVQLGSAGKEHAYATAIDADGNSYVTGYFNGTIDFDPGTGTANLTALNAGDGFIAKYDAAGNYEWAFRFGGPVPPVSSGGTENNGRYIGVDGTGNIVVVGHFNGSTDFDPGPGAATLTALNTTAGDQYVAKYSPAGTYLWAFRFQSDPSIPNPSGLGVTAMTLDGNGNVLVAGPCSGTMDFDPGPGKASINVGAQGGMFVAKYSPGGAYVWAFALPAGTTKNTWYYVADAYDIAVDAANNVYVVGPFLGTVDFNPGAGKANLTSAGLVNAISPRDMYVARYSPSGTYLSAFRIGGTGDDAALSAAIDGGGNLCVTGKFTGTVDFNPGAAINNLTTATGAREIFVASYTPANAYRWAFSMRDSGSTGDPRIGIDGNGDIVVAGGVNGSMDLDPGPGTAILTSPAARGFVATYTSLGAYNWHFGIGLGISALDVRGGAIACAGSFQGTPADVDPGAGTTILTSVGLWDAVLLRYGDAPAPKPNATLASTTTDNTVRIAPNPFSASFTIKSEASTTAQIQVLDMMGRVVESRDVESLDGAFELGSDLPAGTYFVRIMQGESVRTMMVRKVK